jgi:RNA polymerase sigma factor (sigma-70 family)
MRFEADGQSQAGPVALAPETGTPPWKIAAREFAGWREGDPGALDRLVRLLTPTLWQIARACGLTREAAEDVVQTTWLALVRNSDSVREPQAVMRWTTVTTRREAWKVAHTSGRENAVDSEVLDAVAPATAGPETPVFAERAAHALWRQVARLSERCQRLLRVIAFEDKPNYASLATQLGVAVGSVGPTRGRCLDRLRALLADDPEWSEQ